MTKGATRYTSLTELIAAAKKFGALGGKKRAKRMSAKERSDSASKAAKARWAKVRSAKARAKRKDGK